MPDNKMIESEIAAYMGKLLRDNFGKGPTSVYVNLFPPFFIIHIRGFLAPMEKVLVKEKETKRVEETRDVLMNQLTPEIRIKLQQLAAIDMQDLYFDWNLDKQTGMILGVFSNDTYTAQNTWPESLDYHQFNNKIIEMSEWGQKIPALTESFWVSDQMILIKRTGVFVQIEKELIKSGFTEVLKTVKRPLEKRLINQAKLEKIIQRPILESFLDWDFDRDTGYILLILQRNTASQP